MGAHNWAIAAYAPGLYRGPVTLFAARELMDDGADPAPAWRKVAPDAVTVIIPGDHLTCVSTHVAELGAALAAKL